MKLFRGHCSNNWDDSWFWDIYYTAALGNSKKWHMKYLNLVTILYVVSLLSTSQVALVSVLWPERNVYTLDASELPFSKTASSSVCSVLHARERWTLIFTLLCVHLLVVCICCTCILGLHPIPFINIFFLAVSLISHPIFYLFLFLIYSHTYLFFFFFFFLASPAVFSAVCWS